MDGNHSLNRYCNVAVFFEQLGIGLEKQKANKKETNMRHYCNRGNIDIEFHVL